MKGLFKRGKKGKEKEKTASGKSPNPSNSNPGAVSISSGNGSTVFRVTVPANVEPGKEFQVYAGSRIVRVRCPPGTSPGQSLQITVPTEPGPGPGSEPGSGSGHGSRHGSGPTSSLSAQGSGSNELEKEAPLEDSPNVRKITDGTPGQPAAYMVTIPDGILGRTQFPVTIAGQQLMVTCPPNARPGTQVRIVPPPPQPPATEPNGSGSFPNNPLTGNNRRPHQNEDDKTQLFEVQVPGGVKPGQPFALLAGGVRVLVTCPLNAAPGQRIRFKLPLALTVKQKTPLTGPAAVRLSYDKDGWTRSIRVSDMKFQWIRVDTSGDVDQNKRFDVKNSAYVRKLEMRPGDDPRIRTGILSLVPADEAVVESKIKNSEGRDLVSYSDIANAQVKGFEDKASWFQHTCAQLCVEWNEGHMRMNVRRAFLLGDSVDAVMSLSRKDLRKLWRFEFIGEAGIDAGGLAREWFQLVTDEIFDPDMGLWQSSAVNQMSMQVNPASEFCCEDHLVYYRFLGRVMGKALFDRQLVAGHMVQHIYKHMLGWPCTFGDLEMVDEEYYNNLKQLETLVKSGEDLETLCLDFTTSIETLGKREEVELIPGGADIEVSNDNFPEYMEANLKYKLLDTVNAQLNELLLGFFDVIPEPLLTVFDFQELELLMCGLPNIDIDDWKENTIYSGEYDDDPDHPVCQWFWETVGEFDDEMKARLLQFVTGTSGVPSRGFAVLQGNDGNVRKFTIHGVPVGMCLYPRAHTCFNRLDLPIYESKEDLHEKIKIAVTMAATGFDIE